jgi:hypothetical protein
LWIENGLGGLEELWREIKLNRWDVDGEALKGKQQASESGSAQFLVFAGLLYL